jgi:uridine kinase
VEAARVLLDLALSRPPTLGGGRLVCVDGPAGSGKTTLAAAIAASAFDAHVVHMDDLYDGWDGLPRIADQVEPLLRPLAAGVAGHYRRYDWIAGRYAETVAVAPCSLLVLEGVGSGSTPWADLVTAVAWVAAPAALRLSRGIERDGAGTREHWLRWMVEEEALFERESTEARADLVVDGTGAVPPVVRAR